ncbi:MAG: NAD(P)/FAD-dependent oxidoreductase [Candidatus Thermoplasmatota archaeon]|nr:NAD(P)/FAD-dependent oxidoreductase [Candidatus Thermoplasmatota archaeon]
MAETRVVVVGAGIVGGCIARELSRYQLDVHLVEKEHDVGWGATKANTGIIHPGHEEDPARHPLRARLCLAGNQRWRRLTRELDIPARWPGELMVAVREDQREQLERYLHLGERNQVDGLRIMEGAELYEMEPLLHDDVTAALWAPSAGMVAPWEAVLGVVENAQANDAHVHLGCEVVDVETDGNAIAGVATTAGRIDADVVVNAAGLHAGRVAALAGVSDVHITPRRGEYLLFDETVAVRPEHILHPVPGEKSKGVYAVTTVEGNLMLGPTAEDLPDGAVDDRATTREGLEYIWEHAAGLLKKMPSRQAVVKTFAGLRPEPPDGRYVIRAYDTPYGFVNAAGIRSPGLTAAPAIAEEVTRLLREQLDVELEEKETWQPRRAGITRLASQSRRRQQQLIERQPAYGHVVCRCKEVTEAEILEAIRRIRNMGGRVSLDGVKFRTLAMFGFCQGSFCRVQVARLIARELNVPLWQVQHRDTAAYAIGDVKILQEEDT